MQQLFTLLAHLLCLPTVPRQQPLAFQAVQKESPRSPEQQPVWPLPLTRTAPHPGIFL